MLQLGVLQEGGKLADIGLPLCSLRASGRATCRGPVVFPWLTLCPQAQGTPGHVSVTATQRHALPFPGAGPAESPCLLLLSLAEVRLLRPGWGWALRKFPVSGQRKDRRFVEVGRPDPTPPWLRALTTIRVDSLWGRDFLE